MNSISKQFEHLKIELEAIKSTTDNFAEDNCIGEGGYGKVYKGELVQSNGRAMVAIKRLDRKFGQGDPEFWKEIIMLSLYRHENIVSLVGFCDDNGEKILVYEYLSKKSLDLHLTSDDLTWTRRLRICIGAARGLAYLHNPFGTQQRVLHRDIKSSNILIDENWNARISDFGLSKFGPANQQYTFLVSNTVGTVGYCDPLYVETGLLTKESDVYSLGVVLFEVLCGRLSIGIKDKRKPLTGLVRRCYEENTLNTIIYGNIKDEINPDSLRVFTTIAYRCLKIDREQRPSIDEIVTELETALKYQDTQHERIGLLPGVPTAFSDHSSVLLAVQPPKMENYLYSRAKELETSSKAFDSDMSNTAKLGNVKEAIRVTRDAKSSLRPRMRNPKYFPDHFLSNFFIPDYILVPGGEVKALYNAPACPTIVFINSKSGGQLGGKLLLTYQSVLNKNQVFDLGDEAPDKVLRRLYLNLECLKRDGDVFAIKIEKQLRILVAGGDGTVGWLLGVVSDMKLSHPPTVATLPLGTENNLSYALGWGKQNPETDAESVKKFLNQVIEGKEMKIDSWHILLRMKSPKQDSYDPIPPLEFPHSLHAFNCVPDTDELSGYNTFHGGFWSCFTIGMNAQLLYESHCERKLHPEKLKNQSGSQSTYVKGLTQGGFAASLFQPSSRNIAEFVTGMVKHRYGGWENLHIPHSVKSILCLNLPSVSGGLNPWGTPNNKKSRDRDITPSFVDDGLLEIVGFGDAWQGLALLAKGHGTRLAQTSRVRFKFHKGAAEFTYMQMDGEPWKQPLPIDDDAIVVEISHFGRVKMLATKNFLSKTIHDPSSSHYVNQYEDDVSHGKEWRTFGAAETFMIPEDVDRDEKNTPTRWETGSPNPFD